VNPDAADSVEDFSVTFDVAKARVVEGETATVGVMLGRHGFAGAVTVTVAGLPGGVTADPLTIDVAAGTLTLHAATGAAQGIATLTVTAAGGTHSHDATLSLVSMGRPGRPDRSFASAGMLEASPGNGEAMVIQPDGKLVFAGVAIAGDSNLVLINASIGFIRSALALQADGKIVVATEIGHRSTTGLVVRLDPDGSRDASFGTGGEVLLDLSDAGTGVAPSSDLTAVVIQPDGKIVVAGDTAALEGGMSFRRAVVARLTPTGALDESFGNAGHTTTGLGADIASFLALALQPDGRIVAMGASGTVDSTLRFGAFARFDSAGHLDPDFGNNGIVMTSTPFASRAALVLQPDGKILAAGAAAIDEQNACLVRLNGSDGSPDKTLGHSGIKILNFAVGHDDIATGVALQPDGKIVIVGAADSDDGNRGFVARLGNNAMLDDSFAGGIVRVAAPSSSGSTELHAVVLDAEGRIVTAGFASGSPLELVVARFWP
jgi:uncharacterized delta-60 repeat protein